MSNNIKNTMFFVARFRSEIFFAPKRLHTKGVRGAKIEEPQICCSRRGPKGASTHAAQARGMHAWERGPAEGGVGTGRCVDGIGGESAVDHTKEHKNTRMKKKNTHTERR